VNHYRSTHISARENQTGYKSTGPVSSDIKKTYEKKTPSPSIICLTPSNDRHFSYVFFFDIDEINSQN
jgi:hypothetical protein